MIRMLASLVRFLLNLGAPVPTSEMNGSQDAGSPSPLMNLPPEIIIYMALHLAGDRRLCDDFASPTTSRYELAQADLTSLASTCSTLRSILFPIVFLDMRVSSPSRYVELSCPATIAIHMPHKLQVERACESTQPHPRTGSNADHHA